MVLYLCRPGWTDAHGSEVVSRLETAWAEDAAFTHEAHSVTVEGDLVALDFVTWWNEGRFCTGRIEVALARTE
jgi:hypothetical protein